jgi:hypothetical protein
LKVAGVEQFAAGKPLNVSPVAWHDEHGLSHYGYVLADMTLQAFQALDKHCEGARGTDARLDQRITTATCGESKRNPWAGIPSDCESTNQRKCNPKASKRIGQNKPACACRESRDTAPCWRVVQRFE